MTMACSSFLSPNLTPISSTRPIKHITSFNPSLPSISPQNSNNNKEFPLALVASIPYQPVNVDYLQGEFSGHGVTFEGVGDSCVAKLVLDNGSTATLMLPAGLITSYKAHMWHGGAVELLHTLVSEGENGEAVVQGGVSLDFNFGRDGQDLWSPNNWTLHNVRGNPQDSIQVELISNDSEDMVEVKYIVTLREDVLSSELVVSNLKPSPLKMMGCVLSHLTVSTPDATYALGLEGSDFFSRVPVLSNFGIVPPDFGENKESGFGRLLGEMVNQGLLSGWGARNQNNGDEAESKEIEEDEVGEEDDNYKHLRDEMSKIYTSAPTNFTVMDRGRRNSVVVRREGLDELYIFSPGSSHEFYGEYSYICLGQSAMLKPIIIGPEDVWIGGQHLHNPNL